MPSVPGAIFGLILLIILVLRRTINTPTCDSKDLKLRTYPASQRATHHYRLSTADKVAVNVSFRGPSISRLNDAELELSKRSSHDAFGMGPGDLVTGVFDFNQLRFRYNGFKAIRVLFR